MNMCGRTRTMIIVQKGLRTKDDMSFYVKRKEEGRELFSIYIF